MIRVTLSSFALLLPFSPFSSSPFPSYPYNFCPFLHTGSYESAKAFLPNNCSGSDFVFMLSLLHAAKRHSTYSKWVRRIAISFPSNGHGPGQTPARISAFSIFWAQKTCLMATTGNNLGSSVTAKATFGPTGLRYHDPTFSFDFDDSYDVTWHGLVARVNPVAMPVILSEGGSVKTTTIRHVCSQLTSYKNTYRTDHHKNIIDYFSSPGLSIAKIYSLKNSFTSLKTNNRRLRFVSCLINQRLIDWLRRAHNSTKWRSVYKDNLAGKLETVTQSMIAAWERFEAPLWRRRSPRHRVNCVWRRRTWTPRRCDDKFSLDCRRQRHLTTRSYSLIDHQHSGVLYCG